MGQCILAVPRECVFEHAQNMQIQIILCMHKVSSGLLLSFHTLILLVDSKGPDQTVRIRSLIWAFAVRIRHVNAWHNPLFGHLNFLPYLS